MNIWDDLVSRCITQRHLNGQWKTSTLTHEHTCTQSRWLCWNVLECTSFLHKTLIFFLAHHRVTCYSKHALNPLLEEIQKCLTRKHICGVHKYPQGRSLLFVERTTKCLNHKPGAPNLDMLGSGRKWCHSHSMRSSDADKVALWEKETSERQITPLSSLTAFHLVPSRQEWLQPKAIQTFVTDMVHFIVISQRHAESVWVWSKSRTCSMNYKCWGCFLC